MPSTVPLIMRISATEYVEGGYDLNYGVELCGRYKEAGVDIYHISSGGEGPILSMFGTDPGY
jgi:NADPH2 dehydrogenase